jgi:hypothetical protein
MTNVSKRMLQRESFNFDILWYLRFRGPGISQRKSKGTRTLVLKTSRRLAHLKTYKLNMHCQISLFLKMIWQFHWYENQRQFILLWRPFVKRFHKRCYKSGRLVAELIISDNRQNYIENNWLNKIFRYILTIEFT